MELVLIIYLISFGSLLGIYVNKYVEPNFVSVGILFMPIVNTYFAFKLIKWKGVKEIIRVNIKESYKQFMKDIKAKNDCEF